MAADWPGAGKYVAADASAFVNPDDPSTPFTLGEGMLLYTGSTTLTDVAMTLNVATGNGANTINIERADATLTVSGKITQKRGCFIKTGPGTLALTYPGEMAFAAGPANNNLQNRDIKWDETTGASTNGGFSNLTVDNGTLVLGAPGQTNTFSGMMLIGNRSQNNVRLAITNAVVRHSANWFCIARGTGQGGNSASAEVYVGKDASLETYQLNVGYPNGVANAYPRAKLTVDGGRVTVHNQVYALEGTNGKAEIEVKNGGRFVCEGWNDATAGWQMSNSDNTSASVTLTGGSTATARYFGMRPGSALVVNGGSKFLFDRMLPNNGSASHIGTASFDGSVLGTERAGGALWFHCMHAGYYGRSSGLTIGANGIALDIPAKAEAALYPRIRTVSTATAENVTITKRGKGTAAICLPAKNKIAVEEGDLRLRNRMPSVADAPSQTPTVAPGSRLIAAGEGAFANLTIPAGTPLVLRSQGVETETGGNWVCNGWAMVRPDGLISLTDNHTGAAVGTAFHQNALDVSKSFSLTFDIVMYAPTSVWFRDGGLAFVLATTTTARGNGGYNDVGYYGGGFTNGTSKSVAFGMHAYQKALTYGVNGVRSGESVALRVGDNRLTTTLDAPHRARIDYDAATGAFTLTVKLRCGVTRQITRQVNLAETLGATKAYLGFSGSTVGGGPVAYMVSNVALGDLAAPVAMRAGGNATASPAQPLEAEVVADAGDPAIMMKSLTYDDGAVLDIASAAVGGKGEIADGVTLRRDAGWATSGGAHWLDDTSLGLSSGTVAYTNAEKMAIYTCGCAFSPAPIDVDRDWTLSFDYRFGDCSQWVRADEIGIGFMTDTVDTGANAANGFNVKCRYYLSGTIPEGQGSMFSTRLQFLKNGKNVRTGDWVYDAAPVKLHETGAAHFTVAHSKANRTLTITITDAKGTFTKTLEDFDLREMLDGTPTAFLRLQGQVGASWTENIVSNLRFDATPSRMAAQSALGFDAWNGTGTVVKRGSGALAVVAANAGNVSVKVEEGGLYLAKEAANDYRDTGRGGWIRSDKWLEGDAKYGGFLVGAPSPTSSDHNRAANTHYAHRLPMGRSWTLSADCYALGYQDWGDGGAQEWPGNAITIYAHNDPRGLSYTGANNNWGGFGNSVKNGWALNFFTYSDAGAKGRFCWTTSGDRYTTANVSASFAPVLIKNNTTTHFDIVHDAAAKTVKVTLTRGTSTTTTTFEDVDIKSCLGGDEMAWFGFGCGGGWAHGMFNWHNMRLTFPDGADTGADVNFLKDVEIVAAESAVFIDSRRANGVYRLAPTVRVAAGSALLARSVSLPATLTMGTLTLGKGAVVGGDANTVVKPDAFAAEGDLRVEGTTLALSSPNALSERSDVYLTSGAKLRLDFTGSLFVRRIYVDGVRQTGTFGAGTSWLDSASTGTISSHVGLRVIVR